MRYMDGWKDIVETMKETAKPYNVEWAQIKEKFGTLRAYFSCPTEHFDIVEDIVRNAEAQSAKTCVLCGKPGKQVCPDYWIMTLCGECETNRAEG